MAALLLMRCVVGGGCFAQCRIGAFVSSKVT